MNSNTWLQTTIWRGAAGLIPEDKVHRILALKVDSETLDMSHPMGKPLLK